MHGDADKLVPIRYSYNFYNALIAHGHDASLVVVPNQGHGFFTGDEYYNIIFDFFKKHLMN
jgi:dipeptidyl aminopeptidase/acylaminoacyl peptidase